MFREGCFLAGIHCDRSAADVFDVPQPIARRWRKGEVVPPGARVVLGLLREELERDIVGGPTAGTCEGCGEISYDIDRVATYENVTYKCDLCDNGVQK